MELHLTLVKPKRNPRVDSRVVVPLDPDYLEQYQIEASYLSELNITRSSLVHNFYDRVLAPHHHKQIDSRNRAFGKKSRFLRQKIKAHYSRMRMDMIVLIEQMTRDGQYLPEIWLGILDNYILHTYIECQLELMRKTLRFRWLKWT